MRVLAGIFWLGVLPLWLGCPLAWSWRRPEKGGWGIFPLEGWLSGQILLWAIFQWLSLPYIWRGKAFGDLIQIYNGIILLAALAALWPWSHIRSAVLKRWRQRPGLWPGGRPQLCLAWDSRLLLPLAVCLLFALQIYMSIFWVYQDGDDAFFVAVSAIAQESNTMYAKLPYTGGTGILDLRHGLAPFPLWVAWVAKVLDVPAALAAHSVLAPLGIAAAYGVYALLAGCLLEGEEAWKRWLFLLLIQCFVLFGDVSPYTVENFLLARSRQGKAALGSLVIPLVFFALLQLGGLWRQGSGSLRRGKKNAGATEGGAIHAGDARARDAEAWEALAKAWAGLWIFLFCLVSAACLCTTLGAFLAAALVGAGGLLIALWTRRWLPLLPLALCCAPAAFFGSIYVFFG